MKTTVDIADALLVRAKRHARRTGKPLRALVEAGLRHVLDAAPTPPGYELTDCSVGDEQAPNPLEGLSWQDLREEVYGGR